MPQTFIRFQFDYMHPPNPREKLNELYSADGEKHVATSGEYGIHRRASMIFKLLIIMGFAACTVICSSALADDIDLPKLAKETRPAVVLLVVYDSAGNMSATGTGFFVSPDGKLLTSLHVIKGLPCNSKKPRMTKSTKSSRSSAVTRIWISRVCRPTYREYRS